MPRTIPSHERFVELINRFATDYLRNVDVDTHAIPYSNNYSGLGVADYIKVQERTTRRQAAAWILEAAMSDDPPFYLLCARHGGQVYVIQLDADGNQAETLLSQLGLCTAAVEDHLLLDDHGALYSPRLSDDAQPTPVVIEGVEYIQHPPRRASGGQWIATPEALRHLIAEATKERALVAEQDQREKAQETALVDSRHGEDLDRIRALLAFAGVDPGDRHLRTTVAGEHTVLSLTFKDDEITQLADALTDLGLTRLSREEAATRPVGARK